MEQYAQDMLMGKWTRCLVPIAFYEDGNIADGQHRLWAIIESRMPQKFYVERGLTREEGLNIDVGLSRNAVDGAKISGLDPNLTTNMISVSRSIEEGCAGHARTSNAHKLAIVNRHREATEWVCAKGPRGKCLGNGAILGAIGRAWYHIDDKDKLARFCDVLRTGFGNGPHESAAIALRNYQKCAVKPRPNRLVASQPLAGGDRFARGWIGATCF